MLGQIDERWRTTRTVRSAISLTLLGLLGAGILSWKYRHYHPLTRRLNRRAEQEAAFLELARHLLAASNREEVVATATSGALDLAPVIGVHLELAHPDTAEVEIIAAAGERVLQPGTRIPYHGSATELSTAAGYPVLLADAGDASASRAWHRRPSRATSPIAAPLLSGDAPLGALVMVPRPTDGAAPDLTLDRIQILADFVALALRRVILREEAETRRLEAARIIESKVQLIRGLAHDLKNPIGAIAGYAEILEDGIGGELAPPQREYVARIRTAAGSLLRLLDDLVHLSRAEAGNLPFRPTPTDLSVLVNSIIDQFRPQADAHGLRLDCAIHQPLPELSIDPERVRQVIGNLLSNAIKYTPAPGQVMVQTALSDPGHSCDPPPSGHRSKRWLTIAITDSGPGIEPEEQESIFEEFTRLSPETDDGAGLGLAISRHIARSMGGDITLESKPGQGSTFTLWLPAD